MSSDAHPIWINRERFSHRKLAQAAVERILNKFKPGAKLDDEAFTFMEALCRFHPWALSRGPIWDIWVIPGCKARPESCAVRSWDYGFEGYDIRENGRKIPVWRLPFWACFLAVTSRGERFCFDYRDALYQIPGIKELTEACRCAVYEEIKARKSSLMDARGSVSGIFRCHLCPPEKAWSWDDIHMDHVPPLTMAQLIWNWLAEEGEYVDKIPLHPKTTGRWKFAIDDRELLKRWQEYHREHAELRPLCIHHHRMVSDDWYGKRETRPSQQPHKLANTEEWKAHKKSSRSKRKARIDRARKRFSRPNQSTLLATRPVPPVLESSVRGTNGGSDQYALRDTVGRPLSHHDTPHPLSRQAQGIRARLAQKHRGYVAGREGQGE